MQHYNQGYDELYHYGVMGMRWGKRKKEANESFTRDMRKKSDELYAKGMKIDPSEKFWAAQRKKYGDLETLDIPTMEKIAIAEAKMQNTPAYKKAVDLYNQSYRVGNEPVIVAGLHSAGVGMLAVPGLITAAAVISKKAGATGAKRAGIILASGLGGVAASALTYGVKVKSSERELNTVAKEFGIQTFNERLGKK